jgi:hypothetical protein
MEFTLRDKVKMVDAAYDAQEDQLDHYTQDMGGGAYIGKSRNLGKALSKSEMQKCIMAAINVKLKNDKIS